MLNYEKFTNFVFCKFYMKKKDENSSKKSIKIGQGSKLCRDIVSVCHDIILI